MMLCFSCQLLTFRLQPHRWSQVCWCLQTVHQVDRQPLKAQLRKTARGRHDSHRRPRFNRPKRHKMNTRLKNINHREQNCGDFSKYYFFYLFHFPSLYIVLSQSELCFYPGGQCGHCGGLKVLRSAHGQ